MDEQMKSAIIDDILASEGMTRVRVHIEGMRRDPEYLKKWAERQPRYVVTKDE